jgi:hypothetical protein
MYGVGNSILPRSETPLGGSFGLKHFYPAGRLKYKLFERTYQHLIGFFNPAKPLSII